MSLIQGPHQGVHPAQLVRPSTPGVSVAHPEHMGQAPIQHWLDGCMHDSRMRWSLDENQEPSQLHSRDPWLVCEVILKVLKF